MIPFDEKYGEIHARIQEDHDLVSRMYARARELGLRSGKQGDNSKKPGCYFPFATFEGIPLGLHLHEEHVQLDFHHIVAKMRMVYESGGDVFLLRVYAVLGCEDSNQKGIAILSEDVSEGDRYKIEDYASGTDSKAEDSAFTILEKIFEVDDYLDRAIFSIYDENRLVRPVIADLDHLVVKPEYVSLSSKYARQYAMDPRFMIREA